MVQKLHIDIETYSSIDLRTSGVYKYTESIDFEILLIAYAIDDNPIRIIDLAQGEKLPIGFIEWLLDPRIEKHAHNATFERICFKRYGFDIPIDQWVCSAIKAAYCGLPFKLETVSKVMDLGEKGKLSTGDALIRYFCKPCKPTKTNGERLRNFPLHDISKWNEFKTYCINDVEAEREIGLRLEKYDITNFERENYILDQEINDRGIRIDTPFAKTAFETDEKFSKETKDRVIELTNIENPNSLPQLKGWISEAIGKEVETLAKEAIPELLENTDSEAVREVLECRKKLSKTSTKKYISMINCVCGDGRAHGLFQFYGANRTGRWAGRLIQLQNLPQNHMEDLKEAREIIASRDYDLAKMLYDSIPSVLSELIRTAFIPKPGYIFVVADFSSIEARILSWLAKEQWRMDVFNTHGKIYEASASMMFGVPIEEVTKGSELRQKGKTAELALGYQGSLGAMKKMGGEKEGLSEVEMKLIVKKWRKSNPRTVRFWYDVEEMAIMAIKTRSPISLRDLIFDYDGDVLTIQLPSGKKLYYQSPVLKPNSFGRRALNLNVNLISVEF